MWLHMIPHMTEPVELIYVFYMNIFLIISETISKPIEIIIKITSSPNIVSSPSFSSHVPRWKYFPEKPKLNLNPGTNF